MRLQVNGYLRAKRLRKTPRLGVGLARSDFKFWEVFCRMLPHAGVFNELFGPWDQLSRLFQHSFGFLDRGTPYSFHQDSVLRDAGKNQPME